VLDRIDPTIIYMRGIIAVIADVVFVNPFLPNGRFGAVGGARPDSGPATDNTSQRTGP
jgi:hypothetical protein